MKILVIHTGGTIGSTSQKGVVRLSGNAVATLTGRYKKSRGDTVSFAEIMPISIQSESIAVSDWQLLCKSVVENQHQYDGIILTHGTDTLHFTAAALSVALAGIAIPVVLVAASYPLDDKRSNGFVNFTAAADFIMNCRLPGIFVMYGNTGEDITVYLGSRLMGCDGFTHRFRSINDTPLGSMSGGVFVPNTEKENPTQNQLRARATGIEKGSYSFSDEVLMICPYPGIRYNAFDLKGIKAVIHGLYHSGTASVRGDNTSIIPFAKRCNTLGIELYIAPADSVSAVYSSSDEMRHTNIIPLGKMSTETAYVKLCFAVSQGTDGVQARQFMEKERFFELLTEESHR